jgi:hypothetical protein
MSFFGACEEPALHAIEFTNGFSAQNMGLIAPSFQLQFDRVRLTNKETLIRTTSLSIAGEFILGGFSMKRFTVWATNAHHSTACTCSSSTYKCGHKVKRWRVPRCREALGRRKDNGQGFLDVENALGVDMVYSSAGPDGGSSADSLRELRRFLAYRSTAYVGCAVEKGTRTAR